jgi:hypothetical protein
MEKPWDVLEEDRGGLALSDDADELGPQGAFVVVTFELAGKAVRLARQARSDEIHDAAPRAAVEGRKIVPNRRWLQGRFFHPGHESGCGVGFPLDVTHHAVAASGCNSQSEVESANAGT